MIKGIMVAVLVSSLFVVGAFSQENAENVAILKLIEQFRSEKTVPIEAERTLMAEAAKQYKPIWDFMIKSPDVIVKFSEASIPWFFQKPVPRFGTYLILAFVAGNAEYQLKNHVNADAPYAGVTLAISTYSKIKVQYPTVNFESIEKFIDLEKEGKLKEYLEPTPKT